ncbi:MAG: hypothetical protein MJE77_31035 [Proteobacteria bacterium]|nr:hypothetical protein [Pseudomonadota bacterium]
MRQHTGSNSRSQHLARVGLAVAGIVLAVASGCSCEAPEGNSDRNNNEQPDSEQAAIERYDPLGTAINSIGRVANLEAGVPPMCYTATGGKSNPCWVCHTNPAGQNFQSDGELQLEYSFSDQALSNHWTNLFVDRSNFIASISDEEILDYIRQDNYAALGPSLDAVGNYPGYRPDVDFAAGFDDDGFASDGSGWRAIRFHPFLGSFWPTNGSTDDVFIRLPKRFRQNAAGESSREVYKLNFALLEAAIAGQTAASNGAADRSILDREVEPVDERLIDFDLDGDGAVSERVSRIVRLPKYYAGGASGHPVRPGLYPKGVEFLHSVRYIDPDEPSLMAVRMKELRYSKKVRELSDWGILRTYELEAEEKEEGNLPIIGGSPLYGMVNDFGWQLQAFIEDAKGRLRLQTEEEHRFCMGCHTAIGVTVDQTFSFARKVPGKDGWRYHDLRGLKDRPQLGHAEPEVLTYFKRVGGADEIRANSEMLSRFFPNGVLDEAEVLRASVGGDRDLAWLLAPSRERALDLNRAYLAVVREQSFSRGRDAVLSPAVRVHKQIKNGSTELAKANMVFHDGHLHLEWDQGKSSPVRGN